MAYARRLSELGYLSDWETRILYRELSAAGYRKREPEPAPHESSAVWRKLLDGLREEPHRLTRGRIAAALGFPAEELDGLLFGLVLSQLPGGDEPTPSDFGPHDLKLL